MRPPQLQRPRDRISAGRSPAPSSSWLRYRPPLAQGERIGSTPDGFRVNCPITGGRVAGKRLNAMVEGGGAHALRIREDGTAIVAVKATLRTDEASSWSIPVCSTLERMATRTHSTGTSRAGRSFTWPRRFTCASPAYGWLNRLQCLGIGHVTMADVGVNYDLYEMRLTDAGDPG